ncbi:MAG: hypothetical protein SFX72_11560 [Isosphaeraceae bacterium]|nr:hypothetical protein [Isosphaeraceae bacterium]
MRLLARIGFVVGGLLPALPAFAQVPHHAPASAPVAARNADGDYVIPTGVSVSAAEAPAMEAQLRRLGPPQPVSQGQVVQGQPVMIVSGGSAPGRAVATDAPGYAGQMMPGEPEPIGVMRTNYATAPSPAAASAMRPGMPPQGATPFNPMMGRHGVPMNPGMGAAPYLPSSPANPRPRIFAHLFGLEGIGNAMRDRREARLEARKKQEMIQMYQNSRVDEVPASAVYGIR